MLTGSLFYRDKVNSYFKTGVLLIKNEHYSYSDKSMIFKQQK